MKLTGNRNQCQSCKKYFNSNDAFDLHRTGLHSNRRCRTEDEMLTRGMILKKNGFWVGSQKPLLSHHRTPTSVLNQVGKGRVAT